MRSKSYITKKSYIIFNKKYLKYKEVFSQCFGHRSRCKKIP